MRSLPACAACGLLQLVALLPTAGAAPAEPEPYPTTAGPFVTFTAPITPHGRFTLQPLLFVSFVRGNYDGASQLQPLQPAERASSVVTQLFMEHGLTSSVAVGVQLMLIHSRHELDGGSAATTGAGDTQLFARWTVLQPGRWLPEVTVLGMLKLPTGNYQRLEPRSLGTDQLGTGAWDLTVGLDLTTYLRPVLCHADLFLTVPMPTTIDGVDTRYGPLFNWSGSLELPFWRGRLALMVEASGKHQTGRRESNVPVPDSSVDEVIISAGVEGIFSANLQVLVGYQRTVWGTNSPALDTVGVTVVPTI